MRRWLLSATCWMCEYPAKAGASHCKMPQNRWFFWEVGQNPKQGSISDLSLPPQAAVRLQHQGLFPHRLGVECRQPQPRAAGPRRQPEGDGGV